MILPEEVERRSGSEVTSRMELSQKKSGLLYDLIPIVTFPVPQCPTWNGFMFRIAMNIEQN